MTNMKTISCLALALFATPVVALGQGGSASTSVETQRRAAKKDQSKKSASGTPSASAASSNAKRAGPVLRRSNRMEFDGRLIKGERASGAVYLFQRVPRRLPPLLKLKRDELDRIVWPVLRRGADKPVPVASKKVPKARKRIRKPAARKDAAAKKKRKRSSWRNKRQWRRSKLKKYKAKKKK